MKSIELFAGAGGLGIGVSLAGFQPIELIERDADCCATIRDNRDRGIAPVTTWPLTQGDVRDVDFRQYEGRVRLVTGGPPCQPFSIGGRHAAHGDARDMFPQAVRALREAKPEAFIFENVKGITRKAFRDYYAYIKLQMTHPDSVMRNGESWTEHLARLKAREASGHRRGLRYDVVAHLANAADFGVPQKRERVFFVGFRGDLGIAWNFPVPTHAADALAWSQYRDCSYWDRHRVASKDRPVTDRVRARAWRLDEMGSKEAWRTVRDALLDLPDCERDIDLSAACLNHRFQPGARSYVGHCGSPLDEPAKTLKAGVHGVPGGENMLSRPDGSVRYFSVRESARLQTFPDDYAFQGSWSESMRQLGNAVPVALAKIVADSVRGHLETHIGKGAGRSARPSRPHASSMSSFVTSFKTTSAYPSAERC